MLPFYVHNIVYAAKGNKDRSLNKDTGKIDNNIPLKVFLKNINNFKTHIFFINHIKVKLSCNLVNIFFPM